MPDPANSNTKLNRPEVQIMMRRLNGFARGLGLNEAVIRKIVEKVAADMPMRTNDERLFEARGRLIAAAKQR